MNDSESRQVVRLNATNLRGVAHPIRVKMLGMLRTGGPATATGLARRLDMNTGATSYHLRQLAEYGFVEEDLERGVGRERWWKAAHFSTTFDTDDAEAGAAAETGHTYLRAVAQIHAEKLLHAADERETLPSAWRTAGTFNSHTLKLTPAELRDLNEALEAVLSRYRAGLPAPVDAPEDSAQVTVQFQSFVNSADLDAEES